MKILILNWRDIKNPFSGGAEILTHELAKRWVKSGHEVTVFSSMYPHCLSEETIDGVHIIRQGNSASRYLWKSVHFLAWRYYLLKAQGKFDVIIDEVHGIPFFTPWYVKEKKIVLICEVAGDVWVKMFGKVIGTVGQIIESFYLRFVYHNLIFLTISNSTKEDLIKHGITEKNITVLPMGVTIPENVKILKKEKELTLIFVGRLTVPKGIEDTLFVIKEINKNYPKAKLWILGRGDTVYEDYLKKLSKDLNIDKNTVFWGFVSEEKKFELMSKAHFLIHASIREGFGLTIPESGYVGTPVIAYNSPGIRDIVVNNKNGILVTGTTAKAIVKEVITLNNDKKLYQEICKGARNAAVHYNWNHTASVALSRINKL